MKSQKGFSAIEAVLIIVIIGLVGGIGYYVYQTHQSDQTKHTVSNIKQPLVQFTDKTKLYTFSYPKDWVITNLPLVIEGQSAEKVQNISINYPGGPESDPIIVTSDKTPTQAQQTTAAWEATAKEEPKLFSTLSINGYKAMQRHIEYNDEKGNVVEDTYLITNKDQSSVVFLIQSKRITSRTDDAFDVSLNFDATDKLADFKAIVNSTKFLR
jgi:hypothetical protein